MGADFAWRMCARTWPLPSRNQRRHAVAYRRSQRDSQLTLRAMLRVAAGLSALRMLRLVALRLMLRCYVLLHNHGALMLLVLWCEMLLHGDRTRVHLWPRCGRETVHMRLMHGRARRDVCSIWLPIVTMRVVPRLSAVVVVPIRTHDVADDR